jgi:translation initiation factor IF-3
VLLIDEHNNKVGVVPTIEALRRAHEASLDLVEVSSESTPPVCRILDFGKYKYEQAKKDKASKAKTKLAEMKEVRLGRSMKIDPHDVGIRVEQAHRFLMEGHKVQIVQNFRGRELQHKRLGDARMREIVERLADVSRVEMTPRLNGRRMSMILAPDKAKIDALLRKSGQAKPGAQAQDQASVANPGNATPAGGAPPAGATPAAAPAEPANDTRADAAPRNSGPAARPSRAKTKPAEGSPRSTSPSPSPARG